MLGREDRQVLRAMNLHEWANSESGSSFLRGVVVGSWVTTAFVFYLVNIQPLIFGQ